MGKLSKDRRDVYYRRAKEDGYRARSAYKLLQLNERFDFFRDVKRAVDLCAAPGSWSQVVRDELWKRYCLKGEEEGLEELMRNEDEKEEVITRNEDEKKLVPNEEKEEESLYDCFLHTANQNLHKYHHKSSTETLTEPAIHPQYSAAKHTSNDHNFRENNPKHPPTSSGFVHHPPAAPSKPLIVSVDLQEMAPITGVHILRGDITKQSTLDDIFKYFNNESANIVLCDGAPDVTGMHDIDEYIQAQLLLSALNIAVRLLLPGGTFVAKIFRGESITLIYSQLYVFFGEVTCCKPASSRNSSLEAFVVCRRFGEPLPSLDVITRDMQVPMLDSYYDDAEIELEEEAVEEGDSVRSGLFPFIPHGSSSSLSKKRFLDLAVPFLMCGDLSQFDADRSYELEEGYKHIMPLQSPIGAPYEEAVKEKRRGGI